MKQKILLFAAPFFLSQLVSAQSDSALNTSIKVNYSRSLPTTLYKSMPRTGKSRFFGISPLKFKGNEILIHIYDTMPTKPDDKRTDTYYGLQHCALELFIRHRSGYLRRINSLPFDYTRFVNTRYKSSETVGVALTWLDPKLKRIPIINVDFRDRGVMGACGTNVLAIFPLGLTKRAISQNFDYGADNGSNSRSWGWDFSEPDEIGFLKVSAFSATQTEMKTSVWKWNGQKLRITDHVTEKRD